MNTLPDPSRGHLWLVVAPHAAAEAMLELAARLARQASLRLVDGGNRFHAYQFSRAAARDAGPERRVHEILERVHLARAFTCYQMLTLLNEMVPAPFPVLALDLLATFYDESVPAWEALRLVKECAARLRQLSAQAPVVVSVRPPWLRPAENERIAMLETLQAAAHRTWILEASPDPVRQLPLF